jgi:hypothetical protein
MRGWYEQADNRLDYEALEHVECYRGADALAAQDVAKLMQRLAEYTLGPVLQQEYIESVRSDQKVAAFASSLRAHP